MRHDEPPGVLFEAETGGPRQLGAAEQGLERASLGVVDVQGKTPQSAE
jgi:hypothetical protein